MLWTAEYIVDASGLVGVVIRDAPRTPGHGRLTQGPPLPTSEASRSELPKGVRQRQEILSLALPDPSAECPLC